MSGLAPPPGDSWPTGRCASGPRHSPERRASPPSSCGYQTTDSETTIGAATRQNGSVLIKLVESPFYATGGGQVADSGHVECLTGDCRARVEDVVRLGDDQVVAVVPEKGTIEAGERVHAHVDRAARHATEGNHTATHLLHAALRGGSHRTSGRPARYVGPDKLRFDFTHGKALTPEELLDVERSGQPLDPRGSAGPRDHHDAGGGPPARRDGAVRREVR